MAYTAKNLIKSTSEYVKTYSDIKGVDFSGKSGLKDGRVPYLENMYRDYDKDGELILESVPGYREVCKFPGRINGIFLQKVSENEEYILVHARNKLYRFSVGERDNLTAVPTAIATLKNARSSAFSYSGSTFVMDGEKIISVDRDGTVATLDDAAEHTPYVPTTFKNGKELEQRNLLTDRFLEKYVTEEVSELAYGNPNIKYFITDRKSFTCAVIGVDAGFSGTLYVPPRVRIGNGDYTVTEISSTAFRANTAIDGVVINGSVEKIGSLAFADCTSLKTVSLADSVKRIGKGAFSGCPALTDVYLGTGITSIGEDAFSGCDNLQRVHYAGDYENLPDIEGTQSIMEKVIAPSRFLPIKIELPIFTGAASVSSLTLGGTPLDFDEVKEGDRVEALIAEIPDRYSIPGKEFSVSGIFSGKRKSKSEHGEDICELSAVPLIGGEVIKKCTKASAFDGRIFLYGNPSFPSTVFFSTDKKDAGLYFGSLDFFTEGTEDYPITSVLGAQNTLAILKKADDGNGSIFYHSAEDTKSSVRPKSYPTGFIHRGVNAEGDSAIFFDDPVFISSQGVCALEKKGDTISREVVCRSHNVNAKLLAEDLSAVRFAVWCGYLAVGVGNRIYLADSRQSFTHKTGDREYEWFFMNGVGDDLYTNSIFRFHSIPYSGLLMHEAPDSVVTDDYSISHKSSDGSIPASYVYMAIKDRKRYHAYPTEERKETEVAPITEMIATQDLLFFGCENGTVCVFNNDMRSTPPKRLLANDEDFDEKEYALQMDRRLHPDFYHFNNRSARYVIRIGPDDCDIPYLAKNTVAGSVNIKLRTYPSTALKFESCTESLPPSESATINSSFMSFYDINFSNFSFNTSASRTVALKPVYKKWTEQQLTVFSNEFKSPIGIYSINYRFKINGRIKN